MDINKTSLLGKDIFMAKAKHSAVQTIQLFYLYVTFYVVFTALKNAISNDTQQSSYNSIWILLIFPWIFPNRNAEDKEENEFGGPIVMVEDVD